MPKPKLPFMGIRSEEAPNLGNIEASAVEALDVVLQGLSRLLPDAAQVTHGRQTVASATTKKDTSVTFWAERIFFLSYL